ncbi:type II secretion system protein [Candidatus Saccharibacteria bacterium]|nr:type II secretion system protein [Candidatus Saccharibacteria bacterium]
MKNHKGFTIVELLIVIVVIAILAAITIVAYNGIQTRAENTKNLTAVNQTAKLLRLYKETHGYYPTHSGAAMVCIGRGYTNNTCSRDADGSNSVQNSDSFDNELRKAGSLPQPSTKVLTRDNGRQVSGLNFRQPDRMIRYYINGANQPCEAGGTSHTYETVTECRLVLPQ